MEYEGSIGRLDTVRALHQTIVALREALEQSKSEILELKAKAWPIDSVQEVIRELSIENHVLRQQIIKNSPKKQQKVEESADKENGNKHIPSLEKEASNCVFLNEKRVHFLDATVNLEDKDSAFVGNLTLSSNSEEPQKYKEDGQHVVSEDYTKAVQIQGTKSTSKTVLNLDNPTEEPTIIKKEDKAKNKIEVQSSLGAKKDIPKKTKLPYSYCPRNISPKSQYLETRITVKATQHCESTSKSLESLTVVKSPLNKNLRYSKTFSLSDLSVNREFIFEEVNDKTMSISRDNSEEESPNRFEEQARSPQNDLDQEVDDIELIFTTDDTKDQDFREELVPIDLRESNSNLLNLPLSDLDGISDKELDDDVFHDDITPDTTTNRQSSFEMKRDNSMYNSRSDNSINHEKSLKSYYSYQDSSFENKSLEKDESFDRFDERVRIVETDISKCGIHEMEYAGTRRNTCPNPLQYRPLSHRDTISKGLNQRKCRPILTHSNAPRRESGAQTEISALPGSSWRSESSLGNKTKIGDNFTILPSKYPLPGSRLKLSDKTLEARRLLLSDIGFTSMVPELSRSADHLCPNALKPTTVTQYGQFLKATDLYSPGCLSQKFTWTATTATPSECSRTPSRYSSIYPLSPPIPSRRCSAPVSPSRRAMLKCTPSRVRFANGSLPELRSEWTTVDSGDSTDSLVEEAENYLRRSIDCITNKETPSYGETRRFVPRRASAPEPTQDNVPPQGWQPFLPRLSRDLRPENWVKVITPEGKVKGGRVRYVGPIATHGQENFVGVQLTCPEGLSDGTYGSRRYFQCEPYHGIFVPFKKVIMGWRP